MSSGLVAPLGIIVNPLAGTDVRRLSSPAGHTSHAAKIAMVQRVASAAKAAGAQRVLLAPDSAGLAQRAASLLGGVAEMLDLSALGSRHDTVAGARQLCKQECAAVVVIGGDGTCRDAAIGWPGMPMIALSTGTNNVFPLAIDPVAAGTALGLVATGVIPLDVVWSATKRLVIHVGDDEYIALVDMALLETDSVGSRAVLHGSQLRAVVAAIASPCASGISSIAGRVAPLAGDDPDGIVVYLGGDVRRVRVPLVPGTFQTVAISSVARLARGGVVWFDGPAVLAFDGERDVVVGRDTRISVTIDDGGPRRIDVDRVLWLAARRAGFDVQEDNHG